MVTISSSSSLTISSSSSLQVAIQYHQANQLIQAEQSYHQVLAEETDNPEVLYGLAVLAQQNGKLQLAEEFLKTAVELQPDYVKAWFCLGNLHLAQEIFPQAVIAYRQALALRPDSLPIYNNLGYALQQQGLFDEAINYYEKALELKPNFIEAEANLGNALYAQGKLSREQKLYYAQLNNKLGVARKKAGDLQTAATYYKQAIALQPDLADAHYNLGVVLQEQGELEEAIACYQRLLEINPNYAEVYFNLGKIYQRQKQLQQAILAYRQGLKLINPCYAKAVLEVEDGNLEEFVQLPPQLPQTEVIVGKYAFPAIPPLAVSEDKRPFWTVIIPVYERTDYVLESLASVLVQWTGAEEMEILILDNGSTRSLAELVLSLGAGIVRYYRHPENIGQLRNFNVGIAISQGQWIHLLNDDDYVLPGFYSQLKQGLTQCPDTVGAAFTGYQNIDETGEAIMSQQVYGDYRGLAHQDWVWKIGVSNPLNMVAVVIRRATHEHLGGYHLELPFTSDWELYKRIVSTYDWWYEPEILACYREHSNTVTRELLLAGAQGTSISDAIEFSKTYLPAHCADQITAKSYSVYFNNYLLQASFVLKSGNVSVAFSLIQEALKINQSSEAIAKLFSWLTQDEAYTLRQEIATQLISIPLKNPDLSD
jgi:tetratricopeptide (TPR) repeat protein/glycosyltransferase involved in cell wall biosynthesis